jgi:hypothetical protein
MSTSTIITASSSFFDFANKPPLIGAVIRGRAPVTCLSFHEGGDHLFVASEEDARLRLVDCIKGTSDRAATRYETNGIRIVEATYVPLGFDLSPKRFSFFSHCYTLGLSTNNWSDIWFFFF